MKMQFLLAGAAALALPAVANAAYLPTGPQTNVAVATVTGGGWTQCYLETYGQFGTSLSSILAGCNAGASGARLMLAGRETGSSTLLLLAQAAAADVTFATGTGNTTHNANGSEWYFDGNWSWGFAPGGNAVNRNSCDIVDSSFGNNGGNGSTTTQRLCWHTGGDNMNGGWRVGAFDSLNNSSSFEKVIYTFNGGNAVPEPASWAMMIAGFGLAGAAMRRRAKVAVTYA